MLLSLLLSSLVMGCAPTERPAEPAKSRVDVPVVADSNKPESPDTWCEVRNKGATGPEFKLPALDGAPLAGTGAARWVNVWATWCVPCLEEMPRLVKMQERLAKDGVNVDLQFLSADQDVAALGAWKAKNPAFPTMHVANYADVQPWFRSLQLQNDTLPAHFFVTAEGRVSCVRTGAVEEHHYGTVKELLKGG